MTDRLAIPTLDPRETAGVSTVTEYLYHLTAERYDPYLVFNSVRWNDCITLLDVLKGSWEASNQSLTVDGMEGIQVERILPELEIGDYIFNRQAWCNALAEADTILGVGGASISCLPAALTDREYGCWIGTLVDAERDTQQNFTSLWGFRDIFSRPFLRRYEKFTLKQANIILVQSLYTLSQIKSKYNIKDSKLYHIPFPIDTRKYVPRSKKNSNEIIFVGRFTDPRKNIRLLFKSIAILSARGCTPILTLVGDQITERLRHFAESLGIRELINCEGHIEKLPRRLAKASLFAIPSEQEGLCIAGLEAMSCGLPVVSTRCGGPEGYIQDGRNGFLVPRNDPTAFAEKLEILIKDAKLRSRFENYARETIQNKYSIDTVEERLLYHINEI